MENINNKLRDERLESWKMIVKTINFYERMQQRDELSLW